jgi:putative SOS response-associated peptidase YedK
MPVVLKKADIRPWLRGEAGTELLRPTAEYRFHIGPASSLARGFLVNKGEAGFMVGNSKIS